MSDLDIILASDNLLMKVFAITGWSMPSEDLLADELSRQLSLKLKESYPNYNHLEIEYAFRNYGSSVKDWGKNFNLSLLDEVMQPYIAHRADVSKQEEQLIKPKMLFGNQITTQEEKLQDIADWEAKNEYSISHVPPFLYDYLIEFEKITPTNADKWEAMRKATEILKTQLYTDSLNMRTDDVNRYQAYLKMFESGEYTGDTTHRLKLLAKRVMIIDYLNSKK